MDNKTLDFLFSTLVPCNTSEEAEKYANHEEMKKLMEYIDSIINEKKEKE